MAYEKEITEFRRSADLKSMSLGEKMAHVSNLVINYPRFSEVIEKIEYCRRMSRFSSEPECLYVGGPTGAGKTTVCREYIKRNPRIEDGEITKVRF